MPAFPTAQPFRGGYFSQLIGSARVRYKEKIELCENVDPYTLRLGTDTSADASLLPSVAHGDIVTYLVFSTSFVTLDQMKAYKALESHNYFTSGWVKSLSAKRLGEDKVLLLGEVNHSQRLGECPLKVWVLCKQSGAVVTGHCTCMAGTGETCSHVGACLFAIETGARLNQSTTCTQKENAWLPAYVEKVKYKRLKDIDFSSSKEKKRRLDATSSGSKETKVPKQRKGISAPSPTELKELYAAFNTTGVVPAIFSLLPDYCERFQEPVQRTVAHLRDLYSDTHAADDLETLVAKADTFMSTFIVSEETVKSVEARTKDQSRSRDWFLHRAGRVTASVMKNVCCTSVLKPSISLLKGICYPEKRSVKTPAVTWGLTHEQDAFKAFQDSQQDKHQGFRCVKAGLHLSADYPFVGATPDALVCCSCCGKGVVEFKCPYLLRNAEELTELSAPNSCLCTVNGVMQLRRQHAYYFQIQTQMAVCQVDFCYFVVWTPNVLFVEKILKDDEFCTSMMATAKEFFVKAILPELLSHYFTRQLKYPDQTASEDAYCFCRGPETGKMIACDSSSCQYKWFHFSCVALKKAPKSKHWFCPECKGAKENA
ncbi:uncharacterized protein LOC119382008 [Rhipicephalus sanguineus]|uniref:uncharacterized protein LOC119382008 n=1 Tax=Rhipicephalus sanguineus TaxID=34632 RepID=UPI0018947969|nr:uncharacterized protein LOC119382008 [Rhipicephalus sanguineus]